jgi:hypothetical protein
VDLVGETTAALFMDEVEINAILKEQGVKEGVPVSSINLTRVENNLENIKWTETAELFINNQQQFQVIYRTKNTHCSHFYSIWIFILY